MVIVAVVLAGRSPEIWSWVVEERKEKKENERGEEVGERFLFSSLLFARARLVPFVLLLFAVAFVCCLLFVSVARVTMNGFNSTRAIDILSPAVQSKI